MRASVDEVLRTAEDEGIDAHAAKGGTITLARSPAQWARARGEIDEARAWSLDEDDVRLLDAAEATEYWPPLAYGARRTHLTARDPPRPPVRGPPTRWYAVGRLLRAHTRDGGDRARTRRHPHGSCAAEHVIRATEGYTRS